MLKNEIVIKNALVKEFPALAHSIAIQRERRIFMDVPKPEFPMVFARCVNECAASILCTITGLDEGENLGVIYHLARPDGIMINIKTHVIKSNPGIDTITKIFPNADIYERELVDLFGIIVNGLPEGKRYPLPDNWPEGQYPLRKDFDPKVLDEKEGK